MQRSLDIVNAVITANAFNPSVFRESFLRKLGVLAGDDALKPGFVFSDQLVSVPTARFSLLVLPQQLQVVPVVPDDGAAVIRDVLVPIVSTLPHTRFIAAGINFVWNLDPEGETVREATRRLFSAQGEVLTDLFHGPDARFGYFASKDVGERKTFGVVRLKADFKPVLEPTTNGPPRERIQCLLNFNVDLAQPELAEEAVTELGARWDELKALSDRVTGALVAGPEKP